jgi:hypothetical protein
MKKTIVTVTICCCALVALCQKSPFKFGDIPMEDLTMSIYDKDSSAAAVVLFDFGKAYIGFNAAGAVLTFERHVRIKILNKDGLSWADASIPLYKSGSNEERVLGLKAVTYNLENGKVVESKMNKDAIFKEKFNRNINLQKFTLPNVKEGSVLEYSYTVNSDFLANFPNWKFQYTIPVRYSEYNAIIPDFFVMERYMQGYVPATKYDVQNRAQSGYSEKLHHWVITHVPAFKEEPFMTSEDDYVSKMNFALAYINFPGQPSQEIMGTWEKLVANLKESEYFGKVITGSNYLKKTVEELLAGKTDDLEKIEAIHNYVKSNVEWDGYKDYTAESPKTILEKKKGTSGDINLLLASMLEKAGFEVDMVLLSTRDHGFIRRPYPMSRQLNYVICRLLVNDKFIFLDATEKYIPIDFIPERCLNGEGLLVSNKSTGWISLAPKAKSKSTITADLKLDDNAELIGTVSYLRDGYDALSARKQILTKGQDNYVKDFSKRKSWAIENSAFENLDAFEKAVKEVHTITLGEHAASGGDILYINPFIESQLVENPFKSEKREYPIDYGSPQEKTYMCKITIPESYEIDELPVSKVIALPGNAARFLYNVSQLENTINITSSFQINKALFMQNEYAFIREFYNQVVAKQAEQIVLKKK